MNIDIKHPNYMEIIPFWKRNKAGKIEIDERYLIRFLDKVGFAKYYPSSLLTLKPLFLYKNSNIIEEIIPLRIHESIIKLFESYSIPAEFLPKEDRNAVINELISSKILEREDVLILLPELDKPILSDTRDTAYFTFQNVVYNVTTDGIHFSTYERINNYVWKNHIIPRGLDLCCQEMIYDMSDYYKFLRNVTSTWTGKEYELSDSRYQALMSLQGYLLHGYKSKSNPRAVILMDASNSGEPSGRTGKGLIVDGLSQLRKTVKQDGKFFDPMNKFRFSNITVDSKLFFLDDVKSNFNFENFFSVITEGITVDRKNIHPIYIPYEASPKVIISTNYALSGSGSSHVARKYEFELSNYYSNEHQPIHDFHRHFFEEWDKDQWTTFDSLMLFTVQNYLQNGVQLSRPINIDYKKLILETSKSFIDWVNSVGFQMNEKLNKSDLYGLYSAHCEFEPDCNRMDFTKWLKAYAVYNNLVSLEPHSDRKLYIEFRTK